jgi:hypothetical protein
MATTAPLAGKTPRFTQPLAAATSDTAQQSVSSFHFYSKSSPARDLSNTLGHQKPMLSPAGSNPEWTFQELAQPDHQTLSHQFKDFYLEK